MSLIRYRLKVLHQDSYCPLDMFQFISALCKAGSPKMNTMLQVTSEEGRLQEDQLLIPER